MDGARENARECAKGGETCEIKDWPADSMREELQQEEKKERRAQEFTSEAKGAAQGKEPTTYPEALGEASRILALLDGLSAGQGSKQLASAPDFPPRLAPLTD
eukprot:2796152-Pyramimonas_sp.AAC.1